MRKWNILLLSAVFFNNCLFALSLWQSPDAQLRYHEVCFLTSHNSYAAKDHGYYYAQQRWSIQQQLEAGVRGLMLDTHKDSKTGEVILCHASEWITKIICAGKPHTKLEEALITVRDFLSAHPTEIVTIFLENYVRDKSTLDAPFKSSGLEPFILTPCEWDPTQGWPTIGWMQKNNKRLVIFNSIEKTDLTFYQWEHVVENQWGTLHHGKAAKERHESRTYRSHVRYLYVANYFPRLKINFGKGYEAINSTELDTFLTRLQEGLGNGYCKERLPNFVSLDFVDEGDGMKRVNHINCQKKSLFSPMHQ